MANTSINIPKRINVGFQKRTDTYTEKLAYIIYYDEKGKLRKETSWQGWRDKSIPNEEYDNTPTEGFVLNKKVGDYVSYWNHRQAYVRVYDPRGFEFEITIANLLYILENTNSIVGKGLEGEFVYGWDGKDLILIPVSSPDYKEILEIADKRKNATKFTAKTMVVGATYQNKNLEEVVFLGRYDYYDYCYSDREIIHPFDVYYHHFYNYKKKRKTYWFAKKIKYVLEKEGYWRIFQINSLTNYLIDIVNENPHEEYAFIAEDMFKLPTFSPPDYSKNKISLMDKDTFIKKVEDNEGYGMSFVTKIDISVESILDEIDIENYFTRSDLYLKDGNICERKINPKRQYRYGYGYTHISDEPYYIYEPLGAVDEFYQNHKPIKLQTYLENGKEYRGAY